MTSPHLVRRQSPRAAGLVAFGTCLIASCSSDDDTVSPPVPNTSTAFSSGLDLAQTVNSATLGSLVRVTIKNEAPALGTFQTPVWVGFHDGTFDIYDTGVAASAELEALAEDGANGPIVAAFGAAAGTSQDTAMAGFDGPIAPGESISTTFRVDPLNSDSRYFSYASMVLPSNDAFVANGDPMAHEMFDAGGAFVATGFTVAGTDVLDAGTEVNDEIPANTAFFGQMAPNTGVDEMGTVGNHVGFLVPTSGGILDDPMFTGADFERTPLYSMLTFSFEEVAIESPTGSAFVTVDELAAPVTMTFDLTAQSLSGPATALHLHRGASGVAGPVVTDLTSLLVQNANGATTATGQVNIDADILADLRAGQMYFNLHTDLNPMGEVRGQVSANNVATAALTTANVVMPPTAGSNVTIAVRNLAPVTGTFQTPIWIGLHDGTFDIYDLGSAASAALERIAEDGNAAPLGDSLSGSGLGSIHSVVLGAAGPIAPGETTSHTLRVNATEANNRYLSWASMVIPSNDAFIANADPLAHEIFNGAGTFSGLDFTVPAADARDAGTEANDETPANTAFFGQTTPDTGTMEVANIMAHPGFMPPMSGGILDDPMFAGADFANVVGYEFLRVAVTDSAAPALVASATATAVVPASAGNMTIQITAANLSGPATSAALRSGTAGVDAGAVLVDLSSGIANGSSGTSTVSGTFAVDAALRTALDAGGVYIEITTAVNPGGEVRGQLNVAP